MMAFRCPFCSGGGEGARRADERDSRSRPAVAVVGVAASGGNGLNETLEPKSPLTRLAARAPSPASRRGDFNDRALARITKSVLRPLRIPAPESSNRGGHDGAGP